MRLKAPAKKRSEFDPNTFLSTIGGGRKIAALSKKQTIFVQGDPADVVFYIQKGKVRERKGSHNRHSQRGRFLRRRRTFGAGVPHVLCNRNDHRSSSQETVRGI